MGYRIRQPINRQTNGYSAAGWNANKIALQKFKGNNQIGVVDELSASVGATLTIDSVHGTPGFSPEGSKASVEKTMLLICKNSRVELAGGVAMLLDSKEKEDVVCEAGEEGDLGIEEIRHVVALIGIEGH